MPHNSWGAGLVNNENKLGTLGGKEMRGHLLALKQSEGENNNVKVHISGHMSIPSCLLSAQWEISTRLISFCTVTANMTCPMPEQRLPGLDSCLFWRQGTGAFVSLYLRCWEYAKWAFLSRGFPRPSIFFFSFLPRPSILYFWTLTWSYFQCVGHLGPQTLVPVSVAHVACCQMSPTQSGTSVV